VCPPGCQGLPVANSVVRILQTLSHDSCHFQRILLSYLVSDTQVPHRLSYTVLTLCRPIFHSFRHADRPIFHSYQHFQAENNPIWLAESVTRIAMNKSSLDAVKHTDSSKLIRKPRIRSDESPKRLRRPLAERTLISLSPSQDRLHRQNHSKTSSRREAPSGSCQRGQENKGSAGLPGLGFRVGWGG
jgi:hypothetical protein